MRDKLDTYKIWASENCLWTNWVKPVLFSNMHAGKYSFKDEKVKWDIEFKYDTAVILDLPNDNAVFAGIALAKIGYRPIPLYNGVRGADMDAGVINVDMIEKALYAGADIIQELTIKSDAPPVFLLDSRRLRGLKKEKNRFDNRWSIFPQDMPSASYMISKGIKKVIVKSSEIEVDLKHVLLRYQEAQITIYHCGDDNAIKEIKIKKPPRYKGLFHRFLVRIRLTANSAGGFGGMIPDQSSGGMG